MRITAATLLLAGIATWGYGTIAAQVATPSQHDPIQVRTLALVSNDLSESDRQGIIHAFQGGAYPPEELAERVRQALRDVGFYMAKVDDPQLIGIRDSTQAPSPKIRNVRNRSSLASRFIGVKRRLIELWHQSMRGETRSWTAFSKLNSGVKKKTAYTAATRD